MIRVVFIADFFSNQINGGGETNDSVLINFLREKDIEVETIHSQKIALNAPRWSRLHLCCIILFGN